MAKRHYRKYKRSGTLECPITNTVCRLVKHHIHGRDVKRAEEPWNICWISPTAHDLVHAGDIIIEGWASTTGGRTLLWRYKDDNPIINEGARPHLYGD